MTNIEVCDTTQRNSFDSLVMSLNLNYAILDDYLII
jgi:hypothetical protein